MDDKFIKDNSLTAGKGESEEISWITSNGAHIPIHEGQTKQEAVEDFSEKSLINKIKNDIVELPKQEYAEFCSAIRTKYANKIPAKGTLLYGNNYYVFTHNKKEEKSLCRLKIPILGNEEKINEWEGYNGIK